MPTLYADTRIARLCWNNNGWVKPSGRAGKGRGDSHEGMFGFGHEEWLLDMDKVYRGFHYGFLEPIRKFQKLYAGARFNVLLYTRDSNSGTNYWVGRLNGVVVLEEGEARDVIQHYKREGWLDQMRTDLDAVNVAPRSFTNEVLKNEHDAVNVKFPLESIHGILERPVPVPPRDRRITSYRYRLLNVRDYEEASYRGASPGKIDFDGARSATPDLPTTTTKTFPKSPIEFDLRHNVILPAFLRYLQAAYGKHHVKSEVLTSGSQRIDIARQTAEGYILYEVKTYNQPRISMRVALGQLLEYALYPDGREKIEKLILVSDLEPDPDFQSYLAQLNKIVKIPLGYIQFSVEQNQILKEL
jgi:hypothetical protein